VDNKPVVHLLYAPLAASRAHAITQGKYERGRVGLLSGPSAIGLELLARTDDWILSQERRHRRKCER